MSVNFVRMFFMLLFIQSTIFCASDENNHLFDVNDIKKNSSAANLAVFDACKVQYQSSLIIADWMNNYRSLVVSDLKHKEYHNYLSHMVAMRAVAPLSIKFVNAAVGYGVFAQEKLFQSDFIGEYTGQVLDENDCSTGIYAWDYPIVNNTTDILKEYVIDASRYGNETRFVNDAGEKSNCIVYDIIGQDHIPHIIYIAQRDIEVGEELTIDYGYEYWENRNDFEDIGK